MAEASGQTAAFCPFKGNLRAQSFLNSPPSFQVLHRLRAREGDEGVPEGQGLLQDGSG